MESARLPYIRTVQSARYSLPIAVEMEELFGDADHFITHYGFRTQGTREFDETPRIWNTVVFFGGRYELTMQIPVQVDYSKDTVTAAGEPIFLLSEVVVIAPGGTEATYGKTHSFSKEEWATLYSNDGDFSSIGITLRTGAPVANFVEYVQLCRRPRLHISLNAEDEEE